MTISEATTTTATTTDRLALAVTGDLRDRFWKRVDKNGPVLVARLGRCWVWTGGLNDAGYGQMLLDGRGSPLCRAHRISFLLADGRWPDPCALHKCDNRPCVRRSHLYEGTKAQNVADMMSRGRHVVGRRYSGEANGFAKLTDAERALVPVLRAQGATLKSIGDRFGVTRQAIRYVMNRGEA